MARKRHITKAERDEAIANLREWLKPGDTVYCILRHVSRSGMLRFIELKHIDINDNGKPYIVTISGRAATALGMTYDAERGGIRIGGAGMDMGFALVHELRRVLDMPLRHEWI